MGKNIVVFSDGTGQDGGVGYDSNVYKLFISAENRTKRQILYYDKGVGSSWFRFRAKATGYGISKNIMECYRFIFENFEAGDQIYLFGFSRGAATVRSLSGFIHAFGILPKSRPELIKKAYKIYKIRGKQKRLDAEKAFVDRHHTMWTKIKFIGVWDTVTALGLPIPFLDMFVHFIPSFKHNFHDLTLSKGVENAYHALAIDDERKVFHPTLWDETTIEGQNLEQVWFLGMHSNVGGGYRENGLSSIALNWMIEKSTEHDLLIFSKNFINTNDNANATMSDSRASMYEKIMYKKSVRFWPEEDSEGVKRGAPSIHDSVSKRTKNVKNTDKPPYKSWITPYLNDKK